MPKPVKTRPKQKVKPKQKAQPQTQSITATKPYWIILTAMLAVVTAVFGALVGMSLERTALVVVTVVVVIGFVGLVRTGKSELPLSKRATFVFAGASIIGFIIWAALTLSAALAPVVVAVGQDFYVVTSLTTCIAAGACIGELLGRSKMVQQHLFLGMKN
jgi:hypothetical protein